MTTTTEIQEVPFSKKAMQNLIDENERLQQRLDDEQARNVLMSNAVQEAKEAAKAQGLADAQAYIDKTLEEAAAEHAEEMSTVYNETRDKVKRAEDDAAKATKRLADAQRNAKDEAHSQRAIITGLNRTLHNQKLALANQSGSTAIWAAVAAVCGIALGYGLQ